MGDRLASCTDSAGSAWIIADLHGNVAGQTNLSGSSFIDVFRYDAYGGAIGSSGGASTVPSPWRFGGRIVESSAGSTAYDFDARSYVPDLGTFTSLDTVAGSAQNPLTLNRYLYAGANPATLVDPDGHSSVGGCMDHYCPPANDLPTTSSASSLNCGSYSGSGQAECEAALHPVKTAEDKGVCGYDEWSNCGDGKSHVQILSPLPTYHAPAPTQQGNGCSFLNPGGCVRDGLGGLGNAVSNPGQTWADTGGGLVANGADVGNQVWQHTGGDAVNSASDLKDWASGHVPETLTIVVAGAVVVVACVSACEFLLPAIAIAGGGDLATACVFGCTAVASLALPTINLGATVWNASNLNNPSKQIDTAALVGLPSSDAPPSTRGGPDTVPFQPSHEMTDPFTAVDANAVPEVEPPVPYTWTDPITCYDENC